MTRHLENPHSQPALHPSGEILQEHHTGKYSTPSPNLSIQMGNETIPSPAEVAASPHCSFLSLLLQCLSPSLCCEETPTGFVLGQPIPRERCLPPRDKEKAAEESRQKHITKKPTSIIWKASS